MVSCQIDQSTNSIKTIGKYAKFLDGSGADFANNVIGIWFMKAVYWYNLWRLADLGNAVGNGWWQVVWFFKCLIYSSRMFVIVNPAAYWKCLAA